MGKSVAIVDVTGLENPFSLVLQGRGRLLAIQYVIQCPLCVDRPRWEVQPYSGGLLGACGPGPCGHQAHSSRRDHIQHAACSYRPLCQVCTHQSPGPFFRGPGGDHIQHAACSYQALCQVCTYISHQAHSSGGGQGPCVVSGMYMNQQARSFGGGYIQ